MLDRLVSMIFSDGFGLLNFYGLMLEHFVNSDPLALHWSIQPGVSDGCLELFSKLEAAVDHTKIVISSLFFFLLTWLPDSDMNAEVC